MPEYVYVPSPESGGQGRYVELAPVNQYGAGEWPSGSSGPSSSSSSSSSGEGAFIDQYKATHGGKYPFEVISGGNQVEQFVSSYNQFLQTPEGKTAFSPSSPEATAKAYEQFKQQAEIMPLGYDKATKTLTTNKGIYEGIEGYVTSSAGYLANLTFMQGGVKYTVTPSGEVILAQTPDYEFSNVTRDVVNRATGEVMDLFTKKGKKAAKELGLTIPLDEENLGYTEYYAGEVREKAEADVMKVATGVQSGISHFTGGTSVLVSKEGTSAIVEINPELKNIPSTITEELGSQLYKASQMYGGTEVTKIGEGKYKVSPKEEVFETKQYLGSSLVETHGAVSGISLPDLSSDLKVSFKSGETKSFTEFTEPEQKAIMLNYTTEIEGIAKQLSTELKQPVSFIEGKAQVAGNQSATEAEFKQQLFSSGWTESEGIWFSPKKTSILVNVQGDVETIPEKPFSFKSEKGVPYTQTFENISRAGGKSEIGEFGGGKFKMQVTDGVYSLVPIETEKPAGIVASSTFNALTGELVGKKYVVSQPVEQKTDLLKEVGKTLSGEKQLEIAEKSEDILQYSKPSSIIGGYLKDVATGFKEANKIVEGIKTPFGLVEGFASMGLGAVEALELAPITVLTGLQTIEMKNKGITPSIKESAGSLAAIGYGVSGYTTLPTSMGGFASWEIIATKALTLGASPAVSSAIGGMVTTGATAATVQYAYDRKFEPFEIAQQSAIGGILGFAGTKLGEELYLSTKGKAKVPVITTVTKDFVHPEAVKAQGPRYEAISKEYSAKTEAGYRQARGTIKSQVNIIGVGEKYFYGENPKIKTIIKQYPSSFEGVYPTNELPSGVKPPQLPKHVEEAIKLFPEKYSKYEELSYKPYSQPINEQVPHPLGIIEDIAYAGKEATSAYLAKTSQSLIKTGVIKTLPKDIKNAVYIQSQKEASISQAVKTSLRDSQTIQALENLKYLNKEMPPQRPPESYFPKGQSFFGGGLQDSLDAMVSRGYWKHLEWIKWEEVKRQRLLQEKILSKVTKEDLIKEKAAELKELEERKIAIKTLEEKGTKVSDEVKLAMERIDKTGSSIPEQINKNIQNDITTKKQVAINPSEIETEIVRLNKLKQRNELMLRERITSNLGNIVKSEQKQQQNIEVKEQIKEKQEIKSNIENKIKIDQKTTEKTKLDIEIKQKQLEQQKVSSREQLRTRTEVIQQLKEQSRLRLLTEQKLRLIQETKQKLTLEQKLTLTPKIKLNLTLLPESKGIDKKRKKQRRWVSTDIAPQGERETLSDLLSLAHSQNVYGTATSISKKEAQKYQTLDFGMVPTMEQIRNVPRNRKFNLGGNILKVSGNKSKQRWI